MAARPATAAPATTIPATVDRVSVVMDVCAWINALPLSQALSESDWAFPAVESIHVLALTLMAGTIALVDLRLLNVMFRQTRVSEVAGQLLPITWIGFVLMALSGAALFASEAVRLASNAAFQLKLVLLLLAGLNPLVFHFTIYKRVAVWDAARAIPVAAQLSAIASLILWSGIIICGRMIAYFHCPAAP